jgi:hypothetical protein
MQPTRILSWDVGIKHLAYNISEYIEDEETKKINLTIKQWGIINLSLEKCDFCDKDGLYRFEEKYYCSEHCKKLRAKHFCYFEKCYEKAKYHVEAQDVNRYMCDAHGPQIYSTDMATEVLKIKLIEKLDLMTFETFEFLLIENQPTFKNPKMKAIADTLYAWFLIRKIIDAKTLLSRNIRLISPGRKNKLFTLENKEDNKKLEYKDGKKKSIELTLSLITEEWKLFFNTYSKKDDLADCLLQGYSFYTDLLEEKYKQIRKDDRKIKSDKKKEELKNKVKKPRIKKVKN